MQKKHLLSLYLLFNSFIISAQPYYNQRPDYLKANSVWAFGDSAGLDFNSGGPTAIATRQFSGEGCASVADPVTGKLLFYSNGGEVYNANHQEMPNGDSLLGNYSYLWPPRTPGPGIAGYSSPQGVCIVPVINDPGRYYLFSLSGLTSGGVKPQGSLFYNIIDMSLDNGLGDVMTGKKNIALNRQSLSEAMIAVPGNNCDVWLIVHHMYNHEFFSYRITKDGIDTIPVISDHSNLGTLSAYVYATVMAMSPDRQKLIFTFAGEGGLLCDFDPSTGGISQSKKVFHGNFWSAAFSPDNSKTYMNDGNALFQYDLSVNDSATIATSGTLIGTGQFWLSPGLSLSRLYNDTLYLGGGTSLSRVTQPNLRGAACDFQSDAIPLLPGGISFGNLGNDVILHLPTPVDFRHRDTVVCQAESITLNAPEGFDTYLWDDGSNSATRLITSSGRYWVASEDFCNTKVDTFNVVLSSLDPVISVNVQELSTTTAYETYQWLFNGTIIAGATQRTYRAESNGDYQVVVGDMFGCSDTSDIYKITNIDETSISDINDLADQILVYPNPAREIIYFKAPVALDVVLMSIDGQRVKSLNKVNEMDIADLAEGIYFLQIYGRSGILLKAEKLVKTN